MLHISTLINKPIHQVWTTYNAPNDIEQWNSASPDWHCPSSENDLRVAENLNTQWLLEMVALVLIFRVLMKPLKT